MRFAALALVPFLAIPAAQAADDPLALAATLFAGATDGGTILVDGLGRGTVAKTGEGIWEVPFEAGTVRYTLAQPEPCIFTFRSELLGSTGGGSGRLDFTGLREIRIVDYGPRDDLHSLEADFRGPRDLMQMTPDGGETTTQWPAMSIFTTSLTADEVQAAADAMLALCHA